MTERSGNSMHEATLLNNVTYFKSPILTLTASLDDDSDTTIHDILDAYNTFNARIRAVAPLSSTIINTPSALRLVSSCSDSLARCLQRDIRRAFEDPLSSRSQYSAAPMRGGSAMGQCSEDVNRFYEVSMVCQYAIQTTVTILRFPTLSALFSESVVSHLINDVMLVARSSELPGPDSEKTGALAASLFFTLRVPESTFASSKVQILEWMDDLVRSMSPNNEGSKIVHHLLSEYPATFLPKAVHLLPHILSNLITADVARRTDATQALSGYVLGFVSSWPMPPTSVKDEALAAVQQFLRSQIPPSSSNADRKKTTNLPHHLARAITEEAKTSDDRGSRWAITTICCLIVLAGHGVFTGARSLKFVLETVQQVYKAKKRTSEELLACVWRCLVWAFAQIPPEHDRIDKSDQPANARPRSSRKTLFDIVRQDPRFGTGAYLVANLLFARQDGDCRGEDNDISWAILVMKDMLSHFHESVYRDGTTIFARLFSAIGSSALPPPSSDVVPWTPNQTVVRALFTRHILTADSNTFFSHIHAANRLDPSIVRPLSEHEITQHWIELHDLWEICVRRELQRVEFTTLPDGLLATWQALLLVNTHLTQELGHLTATQGCTERIVSAVAAFLDCSEPSTGRPPVPATTSQSRALSVCHKLWTVIRHVFADTWLSEAASALLTRVVQHSFDMSCEEVKDAWGRLCAALVSVSSPDLIGRLATEDERVQIMEVRRRLWRLSAETWTSREPQPNWEDSVEHLAIYVRDWSTAEQDFELWDAVLQCAVEQAEIATGSCMTVYDSLIDRACQSMENFKLQGAPQLAVHLLSRLQVHGELGLSSTFLREISIFLYNIHNNASEDITTALQSLQHVCRLINECPTHSVFALLFSLNDGMTVWVADREEFLSVEEYNDVIVPLYQSALNALRAIPFSFDTLDALAPFLYSAWIRIPAPASAPKAFYEFWCDIQPSLSFSSYDYPDDIKFALRSCHDFFGYDLPEGISLDTESQMETQAHGFLRPSSSPDIPASPTGRSTSGLGVSERDSSSLSPPRHNHSHLYANQPLTFSPRNLRSPQATTPRRGGSRSSTHAPTSPSDAVRARRFAASSSTSRISHEKASRTPERPLKRRKVASSIPAKDSPIPASPILGSAATREAFTSQIVSDGQLLPFQKRPRTPSTPKARANLQDEVKAEELLSPEVPSPTTAARIAPPSSDDYDSWEVPICAEPEPEDEDENEDEDMATGVVPDSQPPGAEDAEDSLVPSFMRTIKGKGKGKARAYEDEDEDIDVLIPDNFSSVSHSTSSSSLGKRTRPTSPLRMHTAPASFARRPLPDAIPAVPLRRAQTGTGSAHLDSLRDAHAAVEMEGSQLELDELLAVEEQASRLQAIVREKLVKRFKTQGRK